MSQRSLSIDEQAPSIIPTRLIAQLGYSTPHQRRDCLLLVLCCSHDRYRTTNMPRLRVLAGPTAEELVPITDIVNTGRAFTISSEHFEGRIAIYVKNFVDPKGRHLTSEYFDREDRKWITWSIQVQGMSMSMSGLSRVVC